MNDTPEFKQTANEPDLFHPILSYAGSSGWSGTETSAARAAQRDSDGTTLTLQRAILAKCFEAAEEGVTVAEMRSAFERSHHGSVSSTLTALHKSGRVVRLTEVRGRCKVYVAPEHQRDRDSEPYVPQASKSETLKAIAALHSREDQTPSQSFCGCCWETYPCRTLRLIGEFDEY
jgi:hypothetical protein